MRQTPPNSSRREAGFTLLEVVIALALFGLLAAALGAGFRFASRTWERGEDSAARTEGLVLAQQQVRRDLSNAVRVAVHDADDKPRLAFASDDSSLTFVVMEPPYPTRAGYYVVRLDLDRRPEGYELWRRRAPFSRDLGSLDEVDFADDEAVMLVDRLPRLAFSFFAAPKDDEDPGGGRWETDWDDPAALPALIRLAGSTDSALAEWPPMTVRPRLDFEPACELKSDAPVCGSVAVPAPPPLPDSMRGGAAAPATAGAAAAGTEAPAGTGTR